MFTDVLRESWFINKIQIIYQQNDLDWWILTANKDNCFSILNEISHLQWRNPVIYQPRVHDKIQILPYQYKHTKEFLKLLIYLWSQAPVLHWPKCWGLRNVNNRQKCTKNFLSTIIKSKNFEQLWKVVENTKVVHYFDNSKGNFFFRGQNLDGLAANQVQNLLTSRGRHLSVSVWSLWSIPFLEWWEFNFETESITITEESTACTTMLCCDQKKFVSSCLVIL